MGGTSRAFVYAPLSEAVTRRVPHKRQNRSWTTINSGAASGVVIAGIAALSVASEWRWAWAVFAAFALISAAWNAWVMPGAQRDTGPSLPRLHLRWLRADAYPLFAFSFLAGIVTMIYWTFATSLIVVPASSSVAAGWTSEELRIVFWTLLGGAGFIGAVGGDLITRFGLKRTIRAICLAMAASIGAFARDRSRSVF